MPAKDTYHDAVKNALIKDSWTILRDPYTIKYEEVQLFGFYRTCHVNYKNKNVFLKV